MKKLYTCCKFFVGSFLIFAAGTVQAQVSSTYTFSQVSGTYTPLVASFPSTPANIYSTTWDDIAYSGYTLPFDFFYNGVLYPAGTTIGLDTDAWIAFNPGTMTGQTSGGSWVSATQSDGVYLSGTANNNGFAGFNADLWYQDFTSITGTVTSGSNVVTSVSSLTNIVVGTRLTGNSNIPDGTVVTAVGVNQFTMSANATGTASSTSITPSAAIFAMTRGTAPNRQFVIQWTQVKRYAGAVNDNFSFQMILEEAPPQALKVVYGTVSTGVTSNLLFQVGLRGNSNADFNARTSSSSWNATSASTSNTNTVSLKNSNVPSSGLTFVWTPLCVTMSAPGAITGSNPVCPNTIQTFSIPAVTGAAYYTWTYSGTGVSFTSTTTSPTNNFSFALGATSGTITVTPANACGSGTSASTPITIATTTPATITYPSGASYCTSNAAVNVTQTGPTGGTYTASPAGLSINSSTGQVTPASSSQGTYTVTYAYTSNGCTALTTSTTVTIQPIVSVNTTSSPAAVCGSGNAQLTAIADGGTNYVVNPVSYNLLSPSGSPVTLWTTTTDDAVSSAISLPFTFSFYGQTISQFTVSTNGFIEMGGLSGLSSISAQTLPNSSTPNNVIAISWRDLKLDLGANPTAYIRYFVNGSSPNRIMVVEYYKVSYYSGGSSIGNVTGQIQLYESDNHIEVHVSTNDGGNNFSKTLGIENSTGTSGLAPAGHNNAAWNASTPEGWSFSLAAYSYSWSPSTFLNNTAIYNPVATAINASTTYSVVATNLLTGCSGTSTVPVVFANTQLLSSPGGSRCGAGSISLTATAASGNIINWYTAASGGNYLSSGGTYNTGSLSSSTTYYVSAEASNPAGNTIVGTGANTGSSYEGIFYHLYGGSQTQFLIRASELITAGLRPGNITQLGIRFSSANSQAYAGFAISMLLTNNTDMSAGLNTGAFTGVYSAASVTPVTGINNYALSTPFYWDGTSNLVVKMCWSNSNSGGTSNYALVDATGYVSCAYYRADSQTPASICGGTTATGTVSSRPQFYFTGSVMYCATTPVAVTATINPQPSAMVMTPASAVLCSSDPALALTFTGGTYTSGTTNAYTQGFETFPAADFASTGAGVTAASNSTYFSEGAKSVRLTHTNNLTTASTTNSYQQNASINLSSYSSATLSFKHICALEGYSTTYDAGYVQYSSNGGGAWTTFPTSAYAGSGTLMTTVNSSSVTGTIFSTKSYPDWISQFTSSATQPTNALWKTETINIPAAALTNNFRIRFMITSDGSTQYNGWFIDDIKIIVPANVTAATVWTPTTGLYTNAGATISYTGTAATLVYARPTGTTTYTATGTATGGCSSSNTVAVTVKPAYTWQGITANWSDAVNWCPGVPTITSDVIINSGVSFMPVLSSGTGTVRNITMNSGTTLTVTNASMQIAGTISTATAGSINATAGTIELAGSATQTVSGSSFSSRSIQNLKASNSVNVSSAANDSLKITGALSFGNVNNKTFNSGDNVILVSNATGTARVADITNNGINSGNSFSGKFVVQRFIPARRAWRLVTAPLVAGAQTINQAWQEGVGGTWSLNPYPGYGTHITGGPARNTTQGYDQGPLNASLYGYTGTAWNYLPATTGEQVTSHEGWMLFVRGSRAINLPLSTTTTVADITTLRPTGAIKYGTQPAVTNATGGFTVVGNPFPSGINFKTINKTGVIGGVGGNAYYLWDPNLGGSNGVGAFVSFSWNGSTYDKSILTGTGTSNISNAGIIPSGAAMMVNLGAGGSITIAEKDKDTSIYYQPYVFRPIANNSSIRTTLYLIDTDGNKGIADGNLVTFSNSYNTGVDNEDAMKPANFKENFGILREGSKLSIERRNALETNDTLFYAMWNLKQQSYELEIATTGIDIPAGSIALLEDRFLQQENVLMATDTLRYRFAVTPDVASSAADRFRIIVVPATVVPVTITSLRAFKQGHDIKVEWKVENEWNMDHYKLEKSVDGIHFLPIRQVRAGSVNNLYDHLDVHPVTGNNFYRVQSVDNNGRVAYSRTVKVLINAGKPSIEIYPNPVTDGQVHLVFSDAATGIYDVVLFNITGQQLFSKQITYAGGSTPIIVSFPESLAKGTYQLVLKQAAAGKQSFKLIIE